MADLKKNDQLITLIVRGIILSSLIIESWLLINPSNLERLLFLFVFIVGLLGLVNAKNFENQIQIHKSGIIIFVGFIIWSMVIIFVSDRDFFQQVYGDYGRNSGFALYLGLSILVLIISSIKTKDLVSRLAGGLVFAGMISISYGVLQGFGIDLLGWDSGGEITGLFGNSNFHSSFVGMSSIAIYTMILFSCFENSKHWFLLSFLLLGLWNIWESDSIQGFFVFVIGCSLVTYFKLGSSTFARIKYFYGVFICLAGFIGGLGLAGVGPLANILRFKTIEIREFYWSAGVAIIKDSPIFGAGFDSYGDLYREFRNQASVIEFGPELVSTAAHNVFIDLGVNGGLPMLVAYLALVLVTFQRSLQVMRRETSVNPYFLALFGSWVGYLAQLFVSMNQVSIAIWGWALTGALLGYERFTRYPIESYSKHSRKLAVEFGFDPSLLVRFIAGGLIGLFIMLPPFISEARFRSALESSDGQKVRAAALAWPRNPVFMVKATEIFRDNDLVEMSKEMAIKTVEQFPRSVYGWRILLTLKDVDPMIQETAKRELSFLDPLNPNLG